MAEMNQLRKKIQSLERAQRYEQQQAKEKEIKRKKGKGNKPAGKRNKPSKFSKLSVSTALPNKDKGEGKQSSNEEDKDLERAATLLQANFRGAMGRRKSQILLVEQAKITKEKSPKGKKTKGKHKK